MPALRIGKSKIRLKKRNSDCKGVYVRIVEEKKCMGTFGTLPYLKFLSSKKMQLSTFFWSNEEESDCSQSTTPSDLKAF